MGGLIGRYGAKELTPAEVRAIRTARIDRAEAYKEDMRSKLKYIYLVADANHPEEGLQKAFEGQALTNAIKKAVGDTRARLSKKQRAEYANPVEHPYPFEWTFDGSKEFADKFSVVALQQDTDSYAVSDEIMKLISSDPPDISRDIAVGGCFELRGQMEAHVCAEAKPFLDFDAIFGEAAKRGLMVASQESKADEGEEAQGEETGSDYAAAAVITIGADHEAWSNPKWQPGPAITHGVEVHTDAPETMADAERDRIEAMITKTGAVVGQMVRCDHCQEVMTTLDVACGDCGSRYNESGLLASRPCMQPECTGQCVLVTPGPEALGQGLACEKCGALHEAVQGTEGVVWQLQPEPVKEAPKPVAGRRRPAPVAAGGASSKAAPKGSGSVPFG